MDLQIKLQDTIFRVRVAGLIKTNKGYIFEKNEQKGYIFTIGGKCMLNESSEEAVRREIKEEIGMEVKNSKLLSIIENFYHEDENKTHEICFVYQIEEEFVGKLPSGFVEVSLEDINKFEIKPNTIKDMLKNIKDNKETFKHFVIK